MCNLAEWVTYFFRVCFSSKHTLAWNTQWYWNCEIILFYLFSSLKSWNMYKNCPDTHLTPESNYEILPAAVFLRELDESSFFLFLFKNTSWPTHHHLIIFSQCEGLCVKALTVQPQDVIKSHTFKLTVEFMKHVLLLKLSPRPALHVLPGLHGLLSRTVDSDTVTSIFVVSWFDLRKGMLYHAL